MLGNPRTWYLLLLSNAAVELFDKVVEDLASAVVVMVELELNAFLGTS
jgi:hypothetical protein